MCKYTVRAKDTGSQSWYDYPCGKCLPCRITQRQEWTLRIMLEMRNYEYSYFVTLTYNDEHLPYGGELNRDDPVKWLKRLRKRVGANRSLRYFGCGEYGEKFRRPHYHFIIMGNDDYGIIFATDSKTGKVTVSDSAFHKSWTVAGRPIGIVDVVIIFSKQDGVRVAQYVASYTLKKLESDSDKDKFHQPFTMASRKPGIGFTNCEYIINNLIKHDVSPKEVNHSSRNCNLQMLRYNGRLWPISRTFRAKLIEAIGGDKRSNTVKKVCSNFTSKRNFSKSLDPDYERDLKLHIEQSESRAKQKVRRWKDAKRKNPSYLT